VPASFPIRPVVRLTSTHWSMINRAAGDLSQPQCRAALEELCAAYWYPLYGYLRRRGYAADEAEDLVQGFFATLLEDHVLRQADPRRGRFRAFLLAAIRNYAGKQHELQRAQKRGGHLRHFSLDFTDAHQRWSMEPADDRTPEAAFDRQWALELLRRVLHTIAEDYRRAGKSQWFEALQGYLTPDADPPSYAELAAQWGVTTTAVKVAVHRLRQTYRRRLEAEIAATVDSPDEIEQERAELLRAFRG
jgi:RNA polymerase sigma factor (sigma-70 family)